MDVDDRSIAVEELATQSTFEFAQRSLSILLVTHNSGAIVGGLLNSLELHPPSMPWELIVVDNDSSDDAPKRIRDQFSDAQIFANDRNVGFAAAVNQAATKATGECYLLVNPDVAWEDDITQRLIQFLERHPKAAAVAPRLAYPDGHPQPSVRRFPTHSNILFSRCSPLAWANRMPWTSDRYTQIVGTEPVRVEAVAAACLMVRSSSFMQVEGMDTRYRLYVEDTDLCRRWSNAGWEVWMDPTVTVTHAWGGRRDSSYNRRHFHRAGIRLYFHTHHAEKRIRNGLLSALLTIADVLDRVWHLSIGRQEVNDE